MLFRFFYFSGVVFVSLILQSCIGLGINTNSKTPKKMARIPVFREQDSLKGFNNEFRSCFDVNHYDIHLSINEKEKSIKGFVTTTFKIVNQTKKIQLDLDEQMVIDSIVQDQKKLTYTRKYTAVFIDLVSTGSMQNVSVYYHGKPKHAKNPPWKGGFVWKKDKNGKPFVSVACEGDGAQLWLPVKMYLGDEPDSVTTHYTVSKDLVAVSNGNLISVTEQGDKKTYTWKTSYLINPYNISLYVGDYKLIESSYTSISGDPVKLSYYVLPYNYEKAIPHFMQVGKILKVYEELFGSYPWTKDGYKLVESPFAGMEHQTAIAYGNGYKNEYKEDFDYIILHETAHEWWGNAVSVADFSDVWIHEGFATYAEALYIEKTKGYDAYLKYIEWHGMTVMNKKPVVGPKGVYYWNYKDGDPYMKGSVILHSLRNQINHDTLFFSILKAFYRDFCYKTATTSDFIALVNQMTGKDLTFFFNQYLYKRESPLLRWNCGYSATGEYGVIYQFDRVEKDFKTKIHMYQGGKVFVIIPSTTVQFKKLPFPAKIPVYMNTRGTYLQDGFGKIPAEIE